MALKMTDAERIDWLEKHPGTAHGPLAFDHPEAGKTGLWYEDHRRSPPTPGFVTADSLREAIDKAATLEEWTPAPRDDGLAERLRSWAQNEEMVDSHFTAHGRDCNEAADAIECPNQGNGK